MLLAGSRCVPAGAAQGQGDVAPPAAPREPLRWIWTSPDALRELPTRGPAWRALEAAARQPVDAPDLADQDDLTDVRVLARALVWARTEREGLRAEVVAACMAAMGTEEDARALALARNLVGYVLAADLVGLPPDEDARFRAWLEGLRRRKFDGRTLVATHEQRPNNWGTHAGAARIAVAAYLGDREDLTRAAAVFRGWLGEREAYAGFRYGDLAWQADRRQPVGVNPAGAARDGHSLDGVLPDDQRRGGPFRWPPPKEGYVWEALQGALVQAALLERAGHDPWEWGDRALLRAVRWLHDEAHFPAEGDDTWQPHLVNAAYGTDFPAPVPSRPGKNVGFTDWTHGERPPQADGTGSGR